MAQLVTIIGMTHNPFMPRLFKQPQQPPGAAKVKERIALMQGKLAAAKPDVLITIGNDHLHQFFMDNMPPFMIGKMDSFHGTFYDETREFGIPECDVPGDERLCSQVLEGAMDRGVDFAYSNELTIDHSIVVPLLFVRPEMDIPIVPILTNCIAPPLPRARRFYEVGRVIRSIIDAVPDEKRVGVLASGHLSLEVGGPKQFERRLLDPDFDVRAVGWITRGDIDAAARDCTFEQLSRSGNMTLGVLNFLMLMGIAGASAPTHAEGLDAGFPAVPFFSWEQKPGEANL
jgi:protocatechuate 4,5-dioxygenase beta chain